MVPAASRYLGQFEPDNSHILKRFKFHLCTMLRWETIWFLHVR